MPNIELAEMLIALVESVQAPSASGLVVTEAEMDVPLEVSSAVRQGEVVIFGSVPHSRWQAGVLPLVNQGRLRVELLEGVQ